MKTKAEMLQDIRGLVRGYSSELEDLANGECYVGPWDAEFAALVGFIGGRLQSLSADMLKVARSPEDEP